MPDLRSLYRQIALETESHNGDLFLAEIVEEQDQEKLLFTAGADGEGRPAGILWSNGIFLPQHIDELMQLPFGHISEIDGKKAFFSLFGSRPRVVVCGTGHVALSLIRILKMLGPEIWVIEDRESFALGAKEAGADEVICTASGVYEEGLSKIPRSSRDYFVCMTREARQESPQARSAAGLLRQRCVKPRPRCCAPPSPVYIRCDGSWTLA